MPRSQKSHDPELVSAAIEAVKSGKLSQRKASAVFNIPLMTLNDKLKGKTPLKPSSRTLLTKEEELKLANWIIQLSQQGFVKTPEEVRKAARKLLELRCDSPRTPTAGWLARFFERHPNLTKGTQLKLRKERATVTPSTIKNWFADFEKYIKERDPEILEDPNRLYSSDETSFVYDVKAKSVAEGAKHVYNVISSNKKLVTVLATVSAAGHYLPPVCIMPYKKIPSRKLFDQFPEAKVQASENGWITPAIFFRFLSDVFIPQTAHIKKPLVLLVDGHSSHTSFPEISTVCKEAGIIVYCLHPHSSHMTQPLHQDFFGAIKAAWRDAARRHTFSTGSAVGLESFAGILKPVWDRSATLKNAEQSFEAAGIFPLDVKRVLESGQFGACLVNTTAGTQPGPEETASGPSTQRNSQLEPSAGVVPSKSKLPEPSAQHDVEEATAGPSTQPDSQLKRSGDVVPSKSKLPQPPAQHDSEEATDASQVDLREGDSEAPCPQPAACKSSNNGEMPGFNFMQISALWELCLFLYNDVSRSQCVRYLSWLAFPSAQDRIDPTGNFDNFKKLALSLLDVCKPSLEHNGETTVTADDILAMPTSASLKDGPKRCLPMMPDISGAGHRKIQDDERAKKEAAEKIRLSNKILRQEKKKRRGEQKELLKERREREEEARQNKEIEEERQKRLKRQAAKRKRQLDALCTKKKRKESSEKEDAQLE